MNLLDLGVLGLLIVGTAWGGLRGFVRIAAILITVVLGSVVAARCYQPVAQFFGAFTDSNVIQDYGGMSVVFVGFAVLTGVIARLVMRGVVAAELGWLNRLAGLVAGAALGVALGGLLIATLTMWLPPESGVLNGSALYPHWLTALQQAERALPNEVAAHLERYRTYLATGGARARGAR